MDKLPASLIINHIIPYTYCPKDPILHDDLLTYLYCRNALKHSYIHEKNYIIAYNDILNYLGINVYKDNVIQISSFCESVLQRNNMLKHFTLDNLHKYIKTQILNVTQNNCFRKLSFLLGLMTIEERRGLLRTIANEKTYYIVSPNTIVSLPFLGMI